MCVRMEVRAGAGPQGGGPVSLSRHLWGFRGVVLCELHDEGVEAPLPVCAGLAWYVALPLHKIHAPAGRCEAWCGGKVRLTPPGLL